MTKPLPLAAAAVALLALSGCGKPQPQVIDTNPDPMANALANAPKVELPPAIKASVTLRCKEDNSLLFVDFFQGEKQVRFRTKEDGPATELKADNPGDAFKDAAGDEIKGDPKKVTFKRAGKGSLTCHT